ncbi:TIGR02270 family protein [Pyxidicoccus sp. MSG2]|uniref:TIGR02270 family protein n=1 Tax=Pyxidicoccus sp. MSG2 TaxID=2996790 RepID=UPI0022716FF6|nr:TIGR02270 family protein [Pyxidicoccus sp. MSG2]MCY1017408.1 TIGR02270 family protein [Pyxidicoccus sp. MSG2]
MPVIEEILEEHLDEASFHWLRWEKALLSAEHDLPDAAAQEERLMAHLDGLVVAGLEAEPLLVPAFESEEPGRIASAAFALMKGHPRGLEEVLARLKDGPPELRAALERALELGTSPGLDSRLIPLLDSDDAGLAASALRVLTSRSAVPVEPLERLLRHEVAEVRMAALAAAAAPALPILPEWLLPALASTHPGIRAAAVEAGMTRHLRPALATCRELVGTEADAAREAMLLLALGGAEADAARLVEKAEDAGTRASALWALGFTGQPCAAEAALRWMEDPAVAPLAAEAFSAITGLVVSGPHALPPREDALHDEEEDLDADLVPGPEAALPRPDAQAIREWWTQHASRFQRGTRYLEGRPLDAAALLAALEGSTMRRRHALARELAIRSRGAHRVPTRGPTWRQDAELARARAAGARLDMRPWNRLMG